MTVIIHAKPAKVPHSRMQLVSYTFRIEICAFETDPPGKYKTLRKTVTTNFQKMKRRREMLKKSVRSDKFTTNTDYWWAKMWRKIDLLKEMCSELENEPNLPSYTQSNKDRAAQVLESVLQTEKHYSQLAHFFAHVPADYAYAANSFKEFMLANVAEGKKIPRRIPPRYVKYFA